MESNRKPLKILQVSTMEFGGGAEGSAWTLYNEYKKRGHKSWMAVGQKHSQNPDIARIPLSNVNSRSALITEIVRTLLETTLRKFPVSSSIRYRLPKLTDRRKKYNSSMGFEDCYYYGSNKIQKLFSEPPDIVHCQNLHGGYFDLESLIQISKEVPVILNLRDAWLLTGHCAHALDCEKWKTGCGGCPNISIYPGICKDSTAQNWLRKANIYKNSKLHIVANSAWMLRQVKDSMLSKHDSCVIENGIDLSNFQPGNKINARIELGLPKNAKIIMFAATNVTKNPWKDFSTMISAIHNVSKLYNKQEIVFLCVGEDQNDQLIGQNAKVKFVGFIRDKKELAKYYQSADLYLHVAKAESFCKTITEAMSCGTPVVASAVGGIPEQIKNGINGFLINPSDPADMTDKIVQILNNKELTKSFCEKARLSSSLFNIDRQVDQFIELYYQLLKK